MNGYEVVLSETAQATIEEEIFNTATDSLDNMVVESGGWMWTEQGRDWEAEGRIEIVEACGPGLGAQKSYDGLVLPTDHLRNMDIMFRIDGLELCGGWHLHPGASGFPSDADLTRIELVVDMRAVWNCRSDRAVELILTRADPGRGFDRGWGFEVWPWVMHRGHWPVSGTPALIPEPAISSPSLITYAKEN
jgi:hypothetical protein